MAKNSHKTLYVGKGFSDYGKDMKDRGVVIESLYYPSVKKGTKISGYNNNCSIEQNGKVICNREKDSKYAAWSKTIEELAPNIKASLLGFGPYKNITITGIDGYGISTKVNTQAKSANGINCVFNTNFSLYITKMDLAKFKKWMAEWGHKFGLRKKGNVWISKSEWENFVFNVLVPFTVDKSVKTMDAPKSNPTFYMTTTNAKLVYDEVKQLMQNYMLNNLGLTVSIYYV